MARKEGVSRTSTELRVEWNELKRLMKLSPEGRLLLHQEHSAPLMDELHE
ncbi:MAG TPA: hypothetical protein VHW24_07310 [Bryobacteraceae bacterium]|nr:hypothetical protein [Bryobacteraceae bacterium]